MLQWTDQDGDKLLPNVLRCTGEQECPAKVVIYAHTYVHTYVRNCATLYTVSL